MYTEDVSQDDTLSAEFNYQRVMRFRRGIGQLEGESSYDFLNAVKQSEVEKTTNRRRCCADGKPKDDKTCTRRWKDGKM